MNAITATTHKKLASLQINYLLTKSLYNDALDRVNEATLEFLRSNICIAKDDGKRITKPFDTYLMCAEDFQSWMEHTHKTFAGTDLNIENIEMAPEHKLYKQLKSCEDLLIDFQKKYIVKNHVSNEVWDKMANSYDTRSELIDLCVKKITN